MRPAPLIRRGVVKRPSSAAPGACRERDDNAERQNRHRGACNFTLNSSLIRSYFCRCVTEQVSVLCFCLLFPYFTCFGLAGEISIGVTVILPLPPQCLAYLWRLSSVRSIT